MKGKYSRPVLYVENFAANQAVSTCTVEGGIEYTFDCMRGPDIDTGRVIADAIASGCNTKIGYASGISTARDYYNSNSHSNNNSSRATWTNGSGYLQVTYSGAQGILYTDSDGWGNFSSQEWSQADGYVMHSRNQGGMHHMVAPVVDSRSVNASW